mmetsp:Transcript_5039/g.7281  ORF Transcript_5039/g.7281 Transcript_5039/m.7281 type:complete len:253 (+) Transcript_5039:82-840(+)
MAHEKLKKNNVTRRGPSDFLPEISSLILSNGLTATEEEAEALALCIVDGMGASESETRNDCLVLFQEYFSLSEYEAKQILVPIFGEIGCSADENESSDDEQNGLDIVDECFEDLIVKEEMIGEDECELCERYIRLTRHHLIPRSTWKRIGPQLFNAANALEKGDVKRAHRILGDGLLHLEDDLADGLSKREMKEMLQRTCNICRGCHSAVHNTYDNMVLATRYNTVEKLIADNTIYKFCKWASKQRPGKSAA